MRIIKEDGAAAGPVNTAGNGGFSNTSNAAGPVAGFDPIMALRRSTKKKVKDKIKRAAPPVIRGIPFSSDSY